MKIAIIGYGKMGHEIEAIARKEGIEVVATIDPKAQGATYREIDKKSLGAADVAIDFSTPDSALNNVLKVAGLGKSIVIGTTGWYDGLDKAKKAVRAKKTGMVYGANFSLGAAIFARIVGNAAKLFSGVPSYDVYIHEEHHVQKADSPSGTAKELGNVILGNMERKKSIVFGVKGKVAPGELLISSVRAGSIPGIHSVGFDSEADTIELKHTARNRSGFAAGAVAAARWIHNRKGSYSVDQFIDEILSEGAKK